MTAAWPHLWQREQLAPARRLPPYSRKVQQPAGTQAAGPALTGTVTCTDALGPAGWLSRLAAGPGWLHAGRAGPAATRDRAERPGPGLPGRRAERGAARQVEEVDWPVIQDGGRPGWLGLLRGRVRPGVAHRRAVPGAPAVIDPSCGPLEECNTGRDSWNYGTGAGLARGPDPSAKDTGLRARSSRWLPRPDLHADARPHRRSLPLGTATTPTADFQRRRTDRPRRPPPAPPVGPGLRRSPQRPPAPNLAPGPPAVSSHSEQEGHQRTRGTRPASSAAGL
jgi:hypothetical protein